MFTGSKIFVFAFILITVILNKILNIFLNKHSMLYLKIFLIISH